MFSIYLSVILVDLDFFINLKTVEKMEKHSSLYLNPFPDFMELIKESASASVKNTACSIFLFLYEGWSVL